MAAHLQHRRSDSGVAAVEFAIVLPVLLLLFFGMINITHYLSAVRRTNVAADLVADLVTRHAETITSSAVDDYFLAAELSFRPGVPADLQIDVYSFFLSNGHATQRWSRSRRQATPCPPPEVTDPAFVALLAQSDMIVAVACLPGYTPPILDYPGLPALGSIVESAAVRPRQSRTLDLVP